MRNAKIAEDVAAADFLVKGWILSYRGCNTFLSTECAEIFPHRFGTAPRRHHPWSFSGRRARRHRGSCSLLIQTQLLLQLLLDCRRGAALVLKLWPLPQTVIVLSVETLPHGLGLRTEGFHPVVSVIRFYLGLEFKSKDSSLVC